jgi:ABC-type branched-subunit amino acid transport system substrate-binding protein
MKRRTLLHLGLISVPVAGSVVACQQIFPSQPREPWPISPINPKLKIRIGSILSIVSGRLLAEEVAGGQGVAARYWKERGIDIEIIYEDSISRPEQGVSVFKELKKQGIKLFTINDTAVALALKPKIQANEATLLSLVATPKISNPLQPGVFRYATMATEEATALFEWVRASGLKHPAVIFHTADSYGVTLTNALQVSLKSINIPVIRAPYVESGSEINTLIKSTLPQETYLPLVIGTGQPMLQIITTLRELGYKGKILANIGYAMTGVKQQLRILGFQHEPIVYTEAEVSRSPHLDAAITHNSTTCKRNLTADAAIGFHSISLLVAACQQLNLVEPSEINLKISQLFASSPKFNQAITTNNEVIVGVKIRET